MTEIRVDIPGDKSVTHRALFLSALASGTSRITGALDAGDTRATAAVLRLCGVPLPAITPRMLVSGAGLGGLRAPAATLDCGNSGTTARLLLGLLAGSHAWAVVTGDTSLRRRPMRRVTQPLAAAGAVFRELGPEDRLPISVEGGGLHMISHDSPVPSAQVKSALLFAGLTGGVRVRVSEPAPSRDHSERMLQALGAPIRTDRINGRRQIVLEPMVSLPAFECDVPGDFSSAAFLLAAGLLSSNARVHMRNVGINPTRTGLLSVLDRMGARIEIAQPRRSAGEDTGDLIAGPADLRAVDVGAGDVPAMIDEIPVLAVLAARAQGETHIRGAAELRVKESDRLAVLASSLRAIGVRADEFADGLAIEGTPAPLSGRVVTHGDHRIAMAFGVLAAQPGNAIEIDDPSAAAVSFPQFWKTLKRCAAAR